MVMLFCLFVVVFFFGGGGTVSLMSTKICSK